MQLTDVNEDNVGEVMDRERQLMITAKAARKAEAKQREERERREIRSKHVDAATSYSVTFSSTEKLGMKIADGGRVDEVKEGSQAHYEFVRKGHEIAKVGKYAWGGSAFLHHGRSHCCHD